MSKLLGGGILSGNHLICVLYVDDERLLLNLTKEFLEQQEPDFQVDTAISVEEALQRLSEEEYDVVVSDYKMPEMDGLEFLSRLRGQGNNIPFIMFTGKGREEVAVEAFARGADGYVVKGGDLTAQYTELVNWVKAAVARRKAQNALKESEEKYRSLVELAHEGIMMMSPSHEITYVNARMADILGREPEELIGSSYLSLTSPGELGSVRENEQKMKLERTPLHHERTLLRTDGKPIHLLVSGTPLFDPEGTYTGQIGMFTDITERKKMEEALREGEEKYHSLVELAHDGIILTEGAERNITFANERIGKMLGYSMEELAMKTFVDLVHPDDMEGYLKDRKTLFTSGKASTFERLFQRKDGSTLNVLVSVSPTGPDIRTESAPAISIITDVTDRKRIEEAVREGERRLLSIIENLGAGLIISDRNTIITYVNPRSAEMLGYTPEEMIGKHGRSLVHKDSLAERDADYADRRKGVTSTIELTLAAKDGRPIPVMKIATPILDEKGEFNGSYSITIDISERKKMEDEIRESEERYRRLFDFSPDGILTVDMKGTITSVNQTFEKRTGYSRDDVVGKHFSKLQTLRVKDIPKYLRMFSTFLKGKLPEPFEIEYQRKDGTQGWSITHTSFIEKEGKKVGIQIVMPDITPRKRIEDREHFLHSLLRHDLRNKLQSVYGYLELLRSTGLKGKQEEYAENLGESAQDAVELIEQVQELRSIEEAKETVDVDLDLAIRDAIKDLSADAEQQGIAVNYKGTSRAAVRANPLLKNTFTNLIGNSIRHANCKQIQITVRELKDRYRITVKDDGKSIPKSVREKLFERGTKGTGSTGSGLGLHLVKRIIETSEGTIELKDTKKGTRFDIYLKKSGSTQGE